MISSASFSGDGDAITLSLSLFLSQYTHTHTHTRTFSWYKYPPWNLQFLINFTFQLSLIPSSSSSAICILITSILLQFDLLHSSIFVSSRLLFSLSFFREKPCQESKRTVSISTRLSEVASSSPSQSSKSPKCSTHFISQCFPIY